MTGAPKRRVMNIINQIESAPRNFYCGTSVICFHQMKSASINIRSAVIDFKVNQLTYHSGGGITLKSDLQEEFSEMLAKRESFIRAL